MKYFKWHDNVWSEKALRIVHTVCGRHDTFEMWIDPAVMETDPPIEVNADGSLLAPTVDCLPDPDVELVERWGEIIWKAPNETAAARDVLAELRNMGWDAPEQFNRINELLLRDALINGLVKKPHRFSDEEFEALKKEIRLGVLAERLDLPPTFTNRRLLSGEFLFDNGKFVSTAEHDRKIARAALQAILDKLGLEIDVTIP